MAEKAFRKVIDLGDGSTPQVFEADTAEELNDLLADAQINASRTLNKLGSENRELKRRQIATPPETDPDGPIVEFRPRDLSNDEAMAIGQEIVNPATARSGLRKVIEAEFGAPIDSIRRTLRRAEITPREMRGREAAEIFLNNHAEYVPSQANSNEMFAYMQKTGRYANRSGERMALTVANFEIAYDALSAAGLLQLRTPQAPAGAPANNGGNGDGTPADSGGTPPGPTRPRFASTSTVTRPSGSPRTSGGSKMPTAEQIEKMSAAEYKKFLATPGATEHVDRLQQEAARRVSSGRR